MKLNRSLTQRSAWLTLLGLGLSNAFIAYTHFPGPIAWVGVGLGLGTAFLWIRFSNPKNSENAFETGEFIPSTPFWAWILLLALSLFLRLNRLDTLSAWPLYDEGMYGYYALHWGEPGRSLFFFGPSQAPPLYIWGLHLFFKLFGASLSSLWLFPALISFLILPAGYWASRQFFTASFSFAMALFFGLGFWPVYVGRFGVMTGLVLLFECLVLGLAGNLWNEKDPSRLPWKAFILGVGWGLGFYTYLHWPLFAGWIMATSLFVLAQTHFKKNRRLFWKTAAYLLVSSFLTLLPLASAFFREGGTQYWDYIRHLASPSGLTIVQRISIALSYIGSLFWGMDLSFHTYQPIWGGYLNPIMDTLFFVGLVQAVRNWRHPRYAWLLASLFLFILPGLLTTERATSRLILVVPILGALAILGSMTLRSHSRKWNLGVLLILFSFSAALDFYHLTGAYGGIWKNLETWKGYAKSYARFQAYGHLKKIAQAQGPGFILDGLEPGLADQTLVVACQSFNALDHPEIPPRQVRWVGVLTNVNNRPFLKARFPEGRAFWLSKNLGEPDGGWMLWVFALTPDRWPEIRRWVAADRALSIVEEQLLCYVPGLSFNGICRSLETLYPLFEGDRFLETCYWGKLADLSFKSNILGKNKKALSPPSPRACLQQALRLGYPAAHLYQRLGLLEWMSGNKARAELDFKKAIRAPLNMTTAVDDLKQLETPSVGTR